MRNEVPINLSNQQLVQYVTVAAPIKPLSKAVQETELEAWPSNEKPKKSGTCWQRRTDKQKNYIIYGILLAAMFIGVSLVIICSVILALAIPYRSKCFLFLFSTSLPRLSPAEYLNTQFKCYLTKKQTFDRKKLLKLKKFLQISQIYHKYLTSLRSII